MGCHAKLLPCWTCVPRQGVNVAVYADPASQSPPDCGSNQHAQSFRAQVRRPTVAYAPGLVRCVWKGFRLGLRGAD